MTTDSKHAHASDFQRFGDDHYTSITRRRWFSKTMTVRRHWSEKCCGERMTYVKKWWLEKCKVCEITQPYISHETLLHCRHCQHIRDITDYGDTLMF